MVNTDNGRGLVPIKTHGQNSYCGNLSLYRKEASVALFLNSPVVVTGSSSVINTNNAEQDGVPLVTVAAAASGTITGVVRGLIHDDDDAVGMAHKTKYFAAGDTGYVLVDDDPDTIFEIQEDSDGNNLVAGDVMEGVDITAESGNTYTGYSTVEIDSSTSAAESGNADQLRVHRLVDRADNVLGANAKWEVMINEHSLRAAQTMI